jgi:hypothetical protein
VPALREGRMIRHRSRQIEAADRSERQIKTHLLAEPSLRADAGYVADADGTCLCNGAVGRTRLPLLERLKQKERSMAGPKSVSLLSRACPLLEGSVNSTDIKPRPTMIDAVTFFHNQHRHHLDLLAISRDLRKKHIKSISHSTINKQ